MDRQPERPGRQKSRPRCRQSEKESSMLRICLESIGPAEDTLSNCFINSNDDQVDLEGRRQAGMRAQTSPQFYIII
jgi:hypothetical protein